VDVPRISLTDRRAAKSYEIMAIHGEFRRSNDDNTRNDDERAKVIRAWTASFVRENPARKPGNDGIGVSVRCYARFERSRSPMAL